MHTYLLAQTAGTAGASKVMTGLSEEGRLRDEIGRSSINSPRRNTSRSSSFVGAFGDKENQDAEARATSVGIVTAASASDPAGSPRESSSAPRGGKRDGLLFAPALAPGEKLSSGPSTENLFGPPKVRKLKVPDTADVRPRGYGTVIGDHGRSSADCNGGGIELPQAFFSPRTGMTTVKSTWSAGGNGARRGRSGSGGSSVVRGAPWFRAKRRVALSLARARGVTPSKLPSKLIHSTPASRAAAFTQPAPVRPRFVPRRCYFGKAVGGGPSKGAENDSAVGESRRKGAVSRITTSNVAGAFKMRELLRERRGFVLSAEFDDEMTAAPASVKETSFATIASAARSANPELTISRPRSRTGGWAGSVLPLSPLARCQGQCSRELEEEARRRSDVGRCCSLSVGDGGACPWMRSEGTSKERLKISLEAVERDDDVLMSPCASVGSSSASKEEAFVERAPGDSVTSSTGSPWSTVSSVGETKREPNAREDRLSGGDPVARMLLKQADDLVESEGVGGDGGGGFAHGPPSPLVGLEKRIMVPLISPRAGRPPIFGVEGRNSCFTIAGVGLNTPTRSGGGRSAEARDRRRASTIPFSVDLGGGSGRTATFWGERGSGSGVPGGTRFGGFFGGVCDSDRGKVGDSGMESEKDRHFRPITSSRL